MPTGVPHRRVLTAMQGAWARYNASAKVTAWDTEFETTAAKHYRERVVRVPALNPLEPLEGEEN
jgi:hypothetical protein